MQRERALAAFVPIALWLVSFGCTTEDDPGAKPPAREPAVPDAEPPPRRTMVMVRWEGGGYAEHDLMPGEWMWVRGQLRFTMPYLFDGETDLTFQHAGRRLFLVRKDGRRQLVGIDLTTRAGLIALDEVVRNRISPITIQGSLERIDEFPPLPAGGYYALTVGYAADLSPLKRVPELSALKIRLVPRQTDLSPLATLKNLKSLSLACEEPSDLSPLRALTRLEVLDLHCQKGPLDLSVLAPLTRLRVLRLDSGSPGPFGDISPLAKLRNLRSLTLRGGTQIADIAPLAKLSHLSAFTLVGCKELTDISPLEQLTDLTWLGLVDCPRIADFSPIAKLTRLSYLGIIKCPELPDLTPLAGLSQLERLTLQGLPKIADLAPLEGLPGLKRVGLLGCGRVRDLWPVRALARKQPRALWVDRLELHEQVLCLQGISPSKINIIVGDEYAAGLGMPRHYVGAPGLWVRLSGGAGFVVPGLPEADAWARLAYPVPTCRPGTVLRFELEGPRVFLRPERGPRRLTGVVATTQDGLDALREAVVQGTSPLVIWAGARSVEALPPLPSGREFTLVLLGHRVPLAPLARVKNLTGLRIDSSEPRVSDLAPLAHLTDLRTLWLDTTPMVGALVHLSKMTKLTSLKMTGFVGLRDLAPLAGLAELRRLELLCTAPPDLTPLAGLPRLKALKLLARMRAGDLSSLGKLRSLEALHLTLEGDVADLTPLANLTRLRMLHFVGCGHIADLSPLAKLQRLEALWFGDCDHVADITPLARLPRLRWLWLSGCHNVTDAATLLHLERRGVELAIDLRLEEKMRPLRK